MLTVAGAAIMDAVMHFLIYLALPFLLLLGFCVTIHELGHFIFAKIFHIPVEKFSIGFGPPFIRKQIGETDFRIAYFPVGGYVKMAGEEEGEILSRKDTTTSESTQPGFYDAPAYKKVLVVFAGPFFNILSAVIVIMFTFVIFGIGIDPYVTIQVEKDSHAARAGFLDGDSIIAINNITINSWDEFLDQLSHSINKEVTITAVRDGMEISKTLMVTPDSLGLLNIIPPILGTVQIDGPAYKAGMKSGDRILKINGNEIETWYEMVDIIRESKQTDLLFEWQHGDEIKSARITPITRYEPLTKDSIRQISALRPHARRYVSLWEAFMFSTERTVSLFWFTLKIFYQLITREISAKAVGGPIAIAKLSAESAQWGIEYLLGLLAVISVNLGLINLFPLPALDGGHILIFVIETIRRKRFSKRTRLIIQQIGYAFILLLIIFITFNDITR
jgi:regulator of sigma E protease